jgi:probable F420-dependent oxidoreductase
VALARRVEDLGYDTILASDHLAEVLAPLPALVAAADTTSRLRVGTFVLNNDLRHPVVLAREAATVDLLTEGRLELGLGAGHMRSEYEEAGVPFDDDATRVQRLGESLAIVKGLLSGERVTFEGRHYRVHDHALYPTPPQRPHPPLLVGGQGRGTLALAAAQADIVGLAGIRHRAGGTEVDLSGFRPDAVAGRVELVRAAAGERFGGLELNALVQAVVVTDDTRAATEKLRQRTPALAALSVDDILGCPFILVGSVDDLANELLRRRDALGVSYYVVFAPAMEVFAPVVERLRAR